MRIRNRNLAAVLLVCVAGFLSGTAADSGASRPKSGDLPQPAPAPVNPDGKGPARVLPDREAKPAGPVALPDGTSQDWWGQVQRQIAEDEYALAWRDADSAKGAAPGWSAFNRAQGFETRFSEAGIRVTPSKEGLSWTWGLSLVAWGRPGALQATGKASLHVEKNRMEVGRTGISEWFVNDERGLEQGFAIPAPPPDSALSPQHSALGGGALSPPDAVSDEAARFPRREGTPHLEPFAEASLGAGSVLPYGLCLDLALTGNLHPKFSEDGQAVDFYDGGTIAVLRYSQLKVTDATGRVLPSRFEGFSSSLLTPHSSLLIASGGGIRISINDSGAIYPITVDPLATSPAWTAESDQAGASLGFSVSSAGDVNGDGYSDVIVGAPYYDNGQTDEGRAYLYLGSASGLSFTPVWTAESDQASANFGYAVASAGDVNGDGYSDVIIGSNGYNIQTGKAYLYLGSASGLSSTATWTAESNQANAYFGCSVSSAGDVNGDGYSDVIVGVPLYDNGEVNEGRAYLYLGSAMGLASTAAWTAESDQAGAYLGWSVSSAGDVNGDGYSDVIVGAPNYDNGQTDEGRAYLYLGSATGPASTAAWMAESDQVMANFGFSVSSAGDVNGDGYSDVIVGAPWYDNGQTDEGRAYLYLGSAMGLSTTSSWTAVGEAASNYFGRSVATAGDVNGDGYSDVIVGAPAYSNGQSSEGRAYLYLGSASGLSAAVWTAESDQASANFGYAVASAGDVNGDGYSDVLVGAPYFDNGEVNEGRAYLYLGSASGISATSSWTAAGEATSNDFGYSVSTAGDVNGDGYSDVVVGAYGYSTSTGKAYLFLGGTAGLSTTSSWSAAGEAATNYFGRSVATAGDVNGDGYSDVLVGADGYSSSAGKAYLYLGGASGLSTTALWTAVGEATGDYFGRSAATAGDVNGDGYSDVVVGAYGNTSSTGKAYLYSGGTSGLSTFSSWTAVGEAVSNSFGYSVATAGDVNGDGYSDVVVGAYKNISDTGKAYLFQGSASGLSAASSWTAVGEAASNYFGYSVSTGGDLNRDGYSDVVVGAYGYNANYGRLYFYYGTPMGLSSSVNWIAGTAGTSFGASVASAGDVNGDGYSDVIVGSPGYSSNRGRARVYWGSPAGFTTYNTVSGEAVSNYFGASVAAAGDVNGDGYSDVVVGAHATGTNTGKAYLYLGNGEAGGGVPLRPMQYSQDGITPIAPLGLAYEKTFRIGLNLRTPVGRDLVRLEWQTVLLGGSFDAVSNPIQHESTWWNSGVTGHYRKASVSLPDEPGPYLWRARIAYFNARSPFQNHGPWFTPVANGSLETDLRSTSATAPPACVLPDEPCWLYSVIKNGTDYTLNFQDPNQSNQRTGWNIRRSNDAAPPKSTWPLVGTNVVDMDQSAPNYQWTDHSGADPGSGGVWYYQVTTYNANCPAEGPF